VVFLGMGCVEIRLGTALAFCGTGGYDHVLDYDCICFHTVRNAYIYTSWTFLIDAGGDVG
jgi:hypothetical protein